MPKETLLISPEEEEEEIEAINYYKKLPEPLEASKCPLLCCFYAEFDIIVGPKVCHESPRNFMSQEINDSSTANYNELLNETFKYVKSMSCLHQRSKKVSNKLANSAATQVPYLPDMTNTSSKGEEEEEEKAENHSKMSIFESASEYIITGPELSNQIICLSTHDMHILSRPTIIEDDKRYERNNLLFSVGLVLRRAGSKQIFCPILSKVAKTLQDMELESCFLSRKKELVQCILDALLVSLNSHEGECNLILDQANVLNLKLFQQPKPRNIPFVADYSVPVLLLPEWQLQMFDWDLTINWIVPHINGLKYTRLIAQSAEVDMEMVRACLRVLKHHGVIAFTDIFQYSNRYESLPLASAMLTGSCEKLLDAALEFVRKSGTSSSTVVITQQQTLDSSGKKSKNNPNSTTAAAEPPVEILSFFPHLSSPYDDSYKSVAAVQQDNTTRTSTQSTQHCQRSSTSTRRKSGTAMIPLASSPYFYKTLSTPPSSSFPPVVLSQESTNAILYPPPNKQAETQRCHENAKKQQAVLKSFLAELYTSLHRNTSFGDLLLEKFSTRKQFLFDFIDHRRFITFGIIHGLIRRIHAYPILVDSQQDHHHQHCLDNDDHEEEEEKYSQEGENEEEIDQVKLNQIMSFMDGSKCDDELSCFFQLPFSKLVDFVKDNQTEKDVCSIYMPNKHTHT